MDIIESLNHRLSFDEEDICYRGEEKIRNLMNESLIELPKDYIEFLINISGDKNYGLSLFVDKGNYEVVIYSAEMALVKREELNFPSNEMFMKSAWLLGDDLGDLIYFYGEGKGGFGIYRGSVGDLNFRYAEKIADSLTDFLVHGIGIDIAITL